MKNFFGKLWSSIKTGASRTWKYAKTHKIISAVVILVIIGGGYWGYTAVAAGNGGTEYVLAAASQGPLQVTVTGSGQVSSEDTLNVTPQGSASGQITEINVKPGQEVTAGTIIAELDDTTAAEAVTSARQDLESANISYQQTLTSSNTSVASDQTSVQTAQTNEQSSVATLATDLSTVMTGFGSDLNDISTINDYKAFTNIDAYEQLINTAESHQYHQQVVQDYTAATTAYQKLQQEYTSTNPSTLDVQQTEQLAEDSIQDAQIINTALIDTLTYYNYINQQLQNGDITVTTQLSTQISTINGYHTTVTNDISNLTSANTALINAEQSLETDSQTLGTSGTVPLNVQSAELNVQKAQETLDEAETTEADYIVRAPFDGTIATVPVNQYDQASSGTTIATLITNEEYADLSLNETDAAKVSVGQPVTMTFDALPGVTMTGAVAELDPVGTVSSGVVTYDVKISFSQNNSAIKPGMTVEATIITNSVANAVQVPSAAVTSVGNSSYVQVATLLNASSTLASAGATGTTGARRTRTASSTSAYAGFAGRSASSTSAYGGYGGGAFGSSTASTTVALTTAMTTRQLTVPASEVKITRVPVTIGISNDTETQIISGLRPGQYVVTATQSAASKTTKSTAASATSLLGGATGRTGAAGGFGGAGGGSYAGRAGGATGGAAAGAK